MQWILFSSLERGETADLQIAANMTAMYPQNPQEHYSSVNPLKTGGVMINGVLCVCGFPKVDIENGYTSEQIIGYMEDVEFDTEGTWTEDWFDLE